MFRISQNVKKIMAVQINGKAETWICRYSWVYSTLFWVVSSLAHRDNPIVLHKTLDPCMVSPMGSWSIQQTSTACTRSLPGNVELRQWLLVVGECYIVEGSNFPFTHSAMYFYVLRSWSYFIILIQNEMLKIYTLSWNLQYIRSYWRDLISKLVFSIKFINAEYNLIYCNAWHTGNIVGEIVYV